MALLLVFTSLNFVVLAEDGWDGVTETPCTNGQGDPDDPYLISTPEELAWFRTLVNTEDGALCAKLVEDIDLNGKYWKPIGGGNFSPGATSVIAFAGVFDGSGHTIKGFNITIIGSDLAPSNRRHIGFFGYAKGTQDNYAVIKNLTIIGEIKIDSTKAQPVSYVSGICATSEYLKVSNCVSDVDITMSLGTNRKATQVGGIVGYAYRATEIVDCENVGDFLGAIAEAGGILGSNASGAAPVKMIRCCNTGNITTDFFTVGGLAGKTSGEVRDCYNAGSVTANATHTTTQASGGLIGRAQDDLDVVNCFSVGQCSFADTDYTGAVYGYMDAAYTYTYDNIFYLESVCDRPCGIMSYKIPVTAMTADEISSVAFVEALNMNAGSTVFKKGASHPIFLWQKEESAPIGTKGDIDGNGTVNATDVSELISRIANDNVPDNAVADMNGDGTVNATDVSELISVIAAE